MKPKQTELVKFLMAARGGSETIERWRAMQSAMNFILPVADPGGVRGVKSNPPSAHSLV